MYVFNHYKYKACKFLRDICLTQWGTLKVAHWEFLICSEREEPRGYTQLKGKQEKDHES